MGRRSPPLPPCPPLTPLLGAKGTRLALQPDRILALGCSPCSALVSPRVLRNSGFPVPATPGVLRRAAGWVSWARALLSSSSDPCHLVPNLCEASPGGESKRVPAACCAKGLMEAPQASWPRPGSSWRKGYLCTSPRGMTASGSSETSRERGIGLLREWWSWGGDSPALV